MSKLPPFISVLALAGILFGVTPAYALEPDRTAIASSPAWKNLLHYFDSNSSAITQASPFFLSGNGREDPRAELDATISEFVNPTRKIGPLSQLAPCAFPARREFLEKAGFRFPKHDCKDFDDFIAGLAPESLTYVYSSAYPNNPASMFGHTLVRVNKNRDIKKSDPLLDYGVNFAAHIPEGELGIKYIPFGLLGLYPGSIEIAPYYHKVLEYNSAESRDLWEYDLAFTPEEARFWVKHVWELRWLAIFRYTFLTKNCSYQIIRTFQVLRPELKNLLPPNPLYILPGDTVRQIAVEYPELIRNVHFRPSHFRVLTDRYEQLRGDESALYENALGSKEKIEGLKSRKVLETLNAFYEYEKIEQQEKVKPETAELLRVVRVTRAKLGGESDFAPVDMPKTQTNRPDEAHATRRVSFTFESGGLRGVEYGVKARLGLHELLNRDEGYESNFGIHGSDVEIVRNEERHQFRIKRLELFDMQTIQPIRKTHFPLSWRLYAGWTPIEEVKAEISYKKEFKSGGGIGMVVSPVLQKLWIGFFVGPQTHFDRSISVRDRLSLLVEPYTLVRFSPRLKWQNRLELERNYRFDPGATVVRSTLAWAFVREGEFRVQGTRFFRTYIAQKKANSVNLEFSLFF